MGFIGSLIGGIFGKKSADSTAKASIEAQRLANEANIQMTNDTNKANLDITNATNKANLDIANATNKANIQIAQMGNEYNREALDRQIEQEWKMWNAENEYNSASSQAARLAEAGLNPWNQQVSPGTASSMTSPSPQAAIVPTMQGATMQAATMEAPYMESAANLILQTGAQKMQAMQMLGEGIGSLPDMALDLLLGNPSAIADIATIKDRIKAVRTGLQQGQVKDIAESSSAVSKAVEDKARAKYAASNAAAENVRNEAVAGYSVVDWMARATNLRYLPQQLQLDLGQKLQNIVLGILNGSMTEQKIDEIMLNNQFLRDTYSARVRQQSAAALHAENNTGADNPWQFGNDIFSGLTGDSVKGCVSGLRTDFDSFVGELKNIFSGNAEKLKLVEKLQLAFASWIKFAIKFNPFSSNSK